MDCKYVRQSTCLCFTFHPLASSLFYLTNTKSRLRIIEENLYTGLVKNQFAVPLKQQNLNVDNFILNYSPQAKQVVLTLSNQILVYSLEQKILIFVGQAAQNKNPCFIQKAVLKKGYLYFSATQYSTLFGVKLSQCIRAGTITSYIKYKMPEVSVVALGIGSGKLIALCSDSNLRVWDAQTSSALKGIAIQRVGEPSCLAFSKQCEYLLIGTSAGVVQVYDVATIGVKNTNILDKQICKQRIQSLAWFHYSGEAQSRRFLVLTKDGDVKLFSFYFQRVKQNKKEDKQKLMGKANFLLLLYSIKSHTIEHNFEICSHQFANFIYFHPGFLLYMVDYYARIYYPVITSQYNHSFESLVPNSKKQIFFQTNFLFIDGLLVKRLRNQPQIKLSLDSVLGYKGLKILKMDYRPKFITLNQLPMQIVKGVPAHKLRYKIMITYYLQNMIRSLVLSDICLAGTNDTIQNLKEFSGSQTLFLGSQSSLHPLIMILQDNKQTITVINESAVEDLSKYNEQQRSYLKIPGEIYSKQIKLKVHKIFETPFRNGYVVVYLSQNLIRFSNNIYVHADLIDYEVYPSLGLRLDYNQIVIDIVWTSRGEIGCVVCLQKVVIINDELKIIKSVPIEGYIIQGQFVGYTLIVTTKVDVQYVDVSGQPLQLFCIENYESRYLILGVLADRILGIERFQGETNCKMRYFNLMQPLISGYVNYYSLLNAPLNPLVLKSIIQGMAPYHIVSQQFLNLLNKNRLTNFSHYFIQSNIKLYSRSIRAATLNGQLKIQRFILNKTWIQHKSKILNYLLYYEDMKDSSDMYQKEKSKEYELLLSKLIGYDSLNSIKQVIKDEQKNAVARPSISNNFGQQSLFEVYYQFSEKQNIFVKMQLLPFKASDDREWIGISGNYLQSKIGQNQNDVDVNAVQAEQEQNQKHEEEQENQEQQGTFDSLIAYYRFDDGKGDFIDDLSDFHNEASVEGEPWQLLPENQPVQLQDKWGKKCPPQFSISSGIVKREKKIGGKPSKSFTFQLWIKTQNSSFILLRLGELFEFGMQNLNFYYKSTKSQTLKGASADYEYVPGSWTNITFTYNSKDHNVNLYLNSFKWYTGKGQANFDRNGLQIGNSDFQGEFTQFRLWRKQLSIEAIKQYLRSPLQIVAEKRKKMKMKIKQKKKKEANKQGEQFFPSVFQF